MSNPHADKDQPVTKSLNPQQGAATVTQTLIPNEMSAGEQPTLADLADQADKQPLNWLVPSTVVEGGIHIIHGKEESFKTTLVMQMLEALNVGGQFLNWDLPGGLKVGFAELEMTERIFKQRARSFMKPARKKAHILVLPAGLRRKILDGKTAEARVNVLVEWAQEYTLDVLAVDSLAKLFPPAANIGSQPAVSDVFSQLQKLGCSVILIAHPRKSSQLQPGGVITESNDEIAGSGRFAQDPDIVLKVCRPDKRAPKSVLSWGKNRLDFKPDDLEMYFDVVDFRLYPLHPFLHILPASREQLVEEAGKRFDWKQRRVDEAIATLKELKDSEDNPLVEEVLLDKQAVFRLRSYISDKELVQSFAVSAGVTHWANDAATICSAPLNAPATHTRGLNPGNVPPTDALGTPQTRGRALRVRKVGARRSL